ncbi:MAG: hypothetical protein IT436_16070 [Phycisphaerales bacterium]|nr:hypothetical protein [Phycisphaerales bacterium]
MQSLTTRYTNLFACLLAANTATAQPAARAQPSNPASANAERPLPSGQRACTTELATCDDLCCDAVSTCPGPSTWASSSPVWTRDGRPLGILFLYSGNFADNMRGLNANWWGNGDPDDDNAGNIDSDLNGRPDCFDWLLCQMDCLYEERSYRRIMLYLPAGVAATNRVTVGSTSIPAFPSGQWHTMPYWRKLWFSYVGTDETDWGVAGWIQGHPDCEVSIYQGFCVNRPCSICTNDNAFVEPGYSMMLDRWYFPCYGESTVFHAPDAYDSDDTCTLYHTVMSWLDNVGISSIWWDAGASRTGFNGGNAPWTMYQQFVGDPDYSGVFTLGAEPLPLNPFPGGWDPGDRQTVDSDGLDQGPFIMTLVEAEKDYRNGAQSNIVEDDQRHTWSVDWDDHEAVIWIHTLPSMGSTLAHEQEGHDDPYPAPGWEQENIYDTLYRAYVSRGFVLSSVTDSHYSGLSATPLYKDFAERLFGFGVIEHPADFDGDGFDGTVSDLDRFGSFYARAQHYYNDLEGEFPNAIFTFYHGDVTGDSVVDSADWDQFMDWFVNGGPTSINLGTMNWFPNNGEHIARDGIEWEAP